MKHLLISRVALYWQHPNLRIPWEEYVINRVFLYNKFTRPSIAQQTSQDFTLISLVDENLSLSDDMFENTMLDNEIELKVKRDGGKYPKLNMVTAITEYVNTLDTKEVIVSRVDSDDLLRDDYIENVKKHLTGATTYVDIARSLTWNFVDVRESGKYRHVCSPFVSVRESVEDFQCLPYRYEHSQVPQHVNGKKSYDVSGIQVIHNNNMINAISGNIVDIDLKRFGL